MHTIRNFHIHSLTILCANLAAAMLPVDVWTASRASPMGMRAKNDSLKVAAVTALMQFNEEELLRFADYFHVENFGK